MTNLARHYTGMSDQTRDDEWATQKEVFAAIHQMKSAIAAIQLKSAIYGKQADGMACAFDDFLHDYMPDERQWEAAIYEARNP